MGYLVPSAFPELHMPKIENKGWSGATFYPAFTAILRG